MAYEVQARVGSVLASDGTIIDPRLAREGDGVVRDGAARYYERTSRGLVFIATTASAGIAPGTALTATGALMLANPAGSGKNLSVIRATQGYVSGLPGAAQMWWTQGACPAALPAETTAALRCSGFLNGTSAGDVAKAYSGVSLTNAPTIVRPAAFGALGVYAIATAGAANFNPMQQEEVAGALVVSPGFYVALEGIGAAGTSPLFSFSIEYEVVPQ